MTTRKKKPKVPKFADRTFNINMIAELLEVPRTSLIEKLDLIGVTGKKVKVGATSRNVLTWDDFAKISKFYRKEIEKKIPQDKCKGSVNQKGGVGKTTIIQQLAMYYALKGLKVLLWDNDPQGHTTLFLGYPNSAGSGPTLKDVYRGEKTIQDIIIEVCPMLHLVPSNTDLSSAELELMMDLNGRKKMKKIVDAIYDSYDIILIDNNPAFSWVTLNAICAVDELCFICETALYSVDGMKGLFEVLEQLEQADSEFGPSLRIIPNKYSAGEKGSQKAINILRSAYGDIVTNTIVNDCADFKNATEDGTPVILTPYKKSKSSHDIVSLAEELLIDSDSDEDTDSAEVKIPRPSKSKHAESMPL